MWGIGISLDHGLECKMVYPLRNTVLSVFKKLNTDLSHDPAPPLLGTPKQLKVVFKQALVHTCSQCYYQRVVDTSQMAQITGAN